MSPHFTVPGASFGTSTLPERRAWSVAGRRACEGAALSLALLYAGTTLSAQTTPDPMMKVSPEAYTIHQTIDFGGRIVDRSGSGPMWNTLVNESSGPRLFGQNLQMHAKDHSAPRLLFDDLNMSSFGFGGDPNNVVMLRLSKGKLYKFSGLFRRDRNYFDYNLLSNPLIPATSNPYLPVLSSPHLSNTVRRMTDTNLTLMPLSRFAVRLGYSSNIWQGPSFSTLHEGADALLSQSLRNSTENYAIGLDWKVVPKTLVSYDQYVTHYRGDTSWSLAGQNYQLSNGAPVSLGIDIFTANSAPCAAPIANATTSPATVNPACNGYLAYTRSAPTRGLYPTEQLRLISSSIDRVQMTGRIAYSQSRNNVPQYQEFFNGLTTRTALRQSIDTGTAAVKRINVTAEGAATVEVTSKLSLIESFQFSNFRIPGRTTLAESAFFGASMLAAPSTFSAATCPPPYTAATCPQHTTSSTADLSSTQSSRFLQQKSKANTIQVAYQPVAYGGLSVGYRYRDREIVNSANVILQETYYPTRALRGDCATGTVLANGTCQAQTITTGIDNVPIHEHWGLFGLWLQPTQQLRMNFNTDVMYADNTYTRISPRQLQHYRFRATYRPQKWISIAGAVNILESRNNVFGIHHLQHSRDYSISASVARSERWAFDLNYSHDSVFSRTDICYVSSAAPATAPGCVTDPAPYLLGTAYYNEPTNFGSANLMLHPMDRVTANVGYIVSSVNGQTEFLNPRQVPGSLQSLYETPYGRVGVGLTHRLTGNAEWRFKEYNESGPSGPTLPRSFRGNLYTLNLRYSY
ncbi:hypothetical protein BH10ACI4_BH10ACI4_24070 [soil metagenome]